MKKYNPYNLLLASVRYYYQNLEEKKRIISKIIPEAIEEINDDYLVATTIIGVIAELPDFYYDIIQKKLCFMYDYYAETDYTKEEVGEFGAILECNPLYNFDNGYKGYNSVMFSNQDNLVSHKKVLRQYEGLMKKRSKC